MPENKKTKKEIWGERKWYLVAGLIIAIVAWLLGYCTKDPPLKPNVSIVYDNILNEPYKHKSKGDINTKYDPKDKIANAKYVFILESDGEINDNNFKIDILSIKKDVKIIDSKISFRQRTLKENVKKSIENNEQFYKLIHPLPVGSHMQIDLKLSPNTVSGDLDWCFVSDFSTYEAKRRDIILEESPKAVNSYKGIVKYAFAEEVKKSDNNTDEIKIDWSSDVKAGLTIGGYNPLLMSNELFILLQRKKLISQKQAMNIKTDIESYKKGILFGGINLLKLNELILNSLISNKAITIEQANLILAESKNSGGVLIGGYNVIILQVEILNSLLKNKKIEMKEGQQVIEQSKPKNN